MEVSDYMAKLEQAINGVDAKSVSIIRYYQDDIMDIVREKQIFEQGIDGLGLSLPNYAQNTFQGQSRGYPKLRSSSFNLFATGNFFNNFMLVAKNDSSFEIINNTSYVKGLFSNSRYEALLRPTDKNLAVFEETIFKKELDAWLSNFL